MPELDIIQLITGTSPTIGIVIYCIYQMRIDRAEALRREIAYSETLRADRKELMDLQRQQVESMVRMERQVHDLKNAIQQWVLDGRRDSLARGKEGG